MNGSVQIRLGSPSGELLASIPLSLARAKNNYTLTKKIKKAAGVENVYLVFVGRKAGVVVNAISFT